MILDVCSVYHLESSQNVGTRVFPGDVVESLMSTCETLETRALPLRGILADCGPLLRFEGQGSELMLSNVTPSAVGL